MGKKGGDLLGERGILGLVHLEMVFEGNPLT